MSDRDLDLAYKINAGMDKLGDSLSLRRVQDAQNWLIAKLEGESSSWLEKLVTKIRPGRVFDQALDKAAWYEKGARKDVLTGLMTGEAFAEEYNKVKEEVERGVVDRVAVMGFDLNAFKEINDTYGHELGDEAIKVFARALEHVLRDGDVVARRQAGGDEFYLLLKIGDGVETLEQIRDIVSARVFERVEKLMKSQKFTWNVPDKQYAKRGIIMLEKDQEMPDFQDLVREIEAQQAKEKEALGLSR